MVVKIMSIQPTPTPRVRSLLCAVLVLCTGAASPPAQADAIEELYNDALAQVRRRLDDRTLDLRLRNVEQDAQKVQSTIEQLRQRGESSPPELRSEALVRGRASDGRILDAKLAAEKDWSDSGEILMARLAQGTNRELERMKPFASKTVDAAQWAAFFQARYKFEAYKLLAGHVQKTIEVFRKFDDELGIIRHALISIPADKETQANLEAAGMAIVRQMNGLMDRELKFVGGMYDVVASVGGG